MSEKRILGASKIEISPMGVGIWSWGDKGFWQYGTTHGKSDADEAFQVSIENGLDFFDTAEIYGQGESEKILGEILHKNPDKKVVVASKFAPRPGRWSAKTLWPALEASLMRLGMMQIDLYQIHWPFTVIPIDDLMDALAEVVKSGRVKAVGVSNYNVAQMRKAHARLAKHGVPLASNQVHYSLLHRKPEANGVLQTCQELNVALIAYSPLEQGLLTGKFNGSNAQKPAGPRRFLPGFWQSNLQKYQPLLDTMDKIAKEHEKSMSEVALNWLLCRDDLVIPIPGAKNAKQAAQNAGAIGWKLGEQEFARIEQASRPWKK